MKAVWLWVTDAVGKLPRFMRLALRTKTGKYLATAFIMQLARRNPWMSSIAPADVIDTITGVLDGATATALTAGTVYANETMADMYAGDMPRHAVNETVDAPSLQRVVVASQPCAVTEWRIDDKLRLVAHLADGRDVVVLPAAQKDAQAVLFQQLLSQVRR